MEKKLAAGPGADGVDPDSRIPSIIRSAFASDAEALARIYNHYVLNTIVTFEETPVAPAEMEARIDEVRGLSLPWLVMERDGVVLGYAYAGKWKGRSAYRFSSEGSLYVADGHCGQGHGSQLYRRLLDELRGRGVHAVIGGIVLPNAASVAIHERFGMSKVAHFKEVGFKFGRWLDVGYWQGLL